MKQWWGHTAIPSWALLQHMGRFIVDAVFNGLSLPHTCGCGTVERWSALCPSILCIYELHVGKWQPQTGCGVLLDNKLTQKDLIAAHLEPLHRSSSILLSSSQENKPPHAEVSYLTTQSPKRRLLLPGNAAHHWELQSAPASQMEESWS